MGGWLHFLVEIELEMAKMPAFTNLKRHCMRNPDADRNLNITNIDKLHII